MLPFCQLCHLGVIPLLGVYTQCTLRFLIICSSLHDGFTCFSDGITFWCIFIFTWFLGSLHCLWVVLCWHLSRYYFCLSWWYFLIIVPGFRHILHELRSFLNTWHCLFSCWRVIVSVTYLSFSLHPRAIKIGIFLFPIYLKRGWYKSTLLIEKLVIDLSGLTYKAFFHIETLKIYVYPMEMVPGARG